MKPHNHKKRNFVKEQALHFTLTSEFQVFYDPRVRQIVDSILTKYSEYFRIKVYHRALVGDHIHLILKANSQAGLANFLRVITGVISLKLRKLKLIPEEIKNFWRSRPWSRLLKWGQDYTIAIKYVALNYLEGTKQVFRTKDKKNRRKEIEKYRLLIEKTLRMKQTVPQKAENFFT